MLNITSRIKLSTKSKEKITKLISKKGLSSKSWDKISKKVKNEISIKLLFNQGPKCVYCERYFIALTNEIDHFAHKGKYPEYTFLTTNLFYACNYCNSYLKNQRNTIYGLPQLDYKKNFFAIVHPYYDNPENEIIFKDNDRVYIDWDRCSDIGKETVKFWNWDKTMMTTIRATTVLEQRLNPLTNYKEKILIQEIIAYK